MNSERAETGERNDTRNGSDATGKDAAGRPPAPGDGPPSGAGADASRRRPEMSDAERSKMREQWLEGTLDRADLTYKEKAAAKKAMKAKDEAREALADSLDDLRRAANKSKPTDKEMRDALSAHRAAVASYRKKIEAADKALVKQLSPQAQARCLSLGILDNGLGRFGFAGPPPPPPPPTR